MAIATDQLSHVWGKKMLSFSEIHAGIQQLRDGEAQQPAPTSIRVVSPAAGEDSLPSLQESHGEADATCYGRDGQPLSVGLRLHRLEATCVSLCNSDCLSCPHDDRVCRSEGLSRGRLTKVCNLRQ